jgi:hypothetical protein
MELVDRHLGDRAGGGNPKSNFGWCIAGSLYRASHIRSYTWRSNPAPPVGQQFHPQDIP